MSKLSSSSTFIHPHNQSLCQVGHPTRPVKNQKQSDKHVASTFHVTPWQVLLTPLHKPSQPINYICKCVVSVSCVPYFFAKTDTFTPFSHAEQKSHNFHCCSSILAAFLRFSTEGCNVGVTFLAFFGEFGKKLYLAFSISHTLLRMRYFFLSLKDMTDPDGFLALFGKNSPKTHTVFSIFCPFSPLFSFHLSELCSVCRVKFPKSALYVLCQFKSVYRVYQVYHVYPYIHQKTHQMLSMFPFTKVPASQVPDVIK
jgi:hypothetical protein